MKTNDTYLRGVIEKSNEPLNNDSEVWNVTEQARLNSARMQGVDDDVGMIMTLQPTSELLGEKEVGQLRGAVYPGRLQNKQKLMVCINH